MSLMKLAAAVTELTQTMDDAAGTLAKHAEHVELLQNGLTRAWDSASAAAARYGETVEKATTATSAIDMLLRPDGSVKN